MDFSGTTVGVVMTGSHCTMEEVMDQVQKLKEEGAKIIPVFSYSVMYTDNRYYRSEEIIQRTKEITDAPIIHTITGAEPIGPGRLFDLLLLAPCTGNTLAKLANGITDTPALMAVKAHLRNQRPVVIAIATNDGLGMNARNIGYLLNVKHIYFVPFRQDDPYIKANSLVARMDLIIDTLYEARQGRQLQPVLAGAYEPKNSIFDQFDEQ